jgi:NAD(P)-dependent dehydrogenase (short-subunit alcohol dehydrogenase family)
MSSSSSSSSEEDDERQGDRLPKEEFDDELTVPNVFGIVCDHTSLASVHACVAELRQVLDSTYRPFKWVYNGIDVLCLNAAVLMPVDAPPQFTNHPDNYEVTLQTNYLAPFLLTNVLQQSNLLNPSVRVIMSSSGLYSMGPQLRFDGLDSVTSPHEASSSLTDATSSPVIPKGFPMVDGTEYGPKESYSWTKLANVAFCAELNRRLQLQNEALFGADSSLGGQAVCFSPGLMTSSGLFRRQPHVTTPDQTHIQSSVYAKEKSISWGAGALVYLIQSQHVEGGQYYSDTISTDGCTVEAYGREFRAEPIRDDIVTPENQQQLWEISCLLTGLTDRRLFL